MMIARIQSATWIKIAFALAILTGIVIYSVQSFSAPSSNLWKKWEAHNPSSGTRVSHADWDRLLQKHVISGHEGVALVSYGRFSGADKARLANYIGTLEKVTVTKLNRAEQRAYWTNLYNALTVKVVVDHYPVRSIKEIDISSGIANGPWKAKLLTVEGEKLSLDDIEHRILRPIWNDPRTHYTINCGAYSCPNLHNRAFTASNLEGTLNKLAQKYVNSPRGLEVVAGDLYASSIYRWFKKDFGGSDQAVINHMKQYARSSLRRELSDISFITSYDYDWALNDAYPQRGAASTNSGDKRPGNQVRRRGS